MFLFCLALWADFTTVVLWGAAAEPLVAATSPPVASNASPSAACLRVTDIGAPLVRFGYECRRRMAPEPSGWNVSRGPITLEASGDASASRQGRPTARLPRRRHGGADGGGALRPARGRARRRADRHVGPRGRCTELPVAGSPAGAADLRKPAAGCRPRVRGADATLHRPRGR